MAEPEGNSASDTREPWQVYDGGGHSEPVTPTPSPHQSLVRTTFPPEDPKSRGKEERDRERELVTSGEFSGYGGAEELQFEFEGRFCETDTRAEPKEVVCLEGGDVVDDSSEVEQIAPGMEHVPPGMEHVPPETEHTGPKEVVRPEGGDVVDDSSEVEQIAPGMEQIAPGMEHTGPKEAVCSEEGGVAPGMEHSYEDTMEETCRLEKGGQNEEDGVATEACIYHQGTALATRNHARSYKTSYHMVFTAESLAMAGQKGEGEMLDVCEHFHWPLVPMSDTKVQLEGEGFFF